MNIFHGLQESRICKNEDALSSDFLPDFLPHRETQIQELAKNLNPSTKGRKPQNTFISGPPGIGKTCVTRFVLRELQSFAGEKVSTIFINTWDYNTAPALLTKLVVELGYPMPRRGLSKDEIMEKLVELLKKSNKSLIVALDEVDQIVKKDEFVLYDLLRIGQYVNMPIGLVMISNYADIFANIEPRIKSSLDTQELRFKGYSIQEMKDILEKRCEEAFRSGVVQEGVVLLCANHAINRGGDVRVGLECLRKAVKVCEDSSSTVITVEHVKDILRSVKSVKMQIMQDRLGEIDKGIIETLSGKGRITFTQLKEEYNRNYEPLSDTTIKQHVDYLAATNLVNRKEIRNGSRGMRCWLSLAKRKKFS